MKILFKIIITKMKITNLKIYILKIKKEFRKKLKVWLANNFYKF